MNKTTKVIRFTNATFVRIDEAVAGADAQLTTLLEQFVLPQHRAAIQDALLDLRCDLIQATVTAAGLTWKDS